MISDKIQFRFFGNYVLVKAIKFNAKKTAYFYGGKADFVTNGTLQGASKPSENCQEPK